MCVQLIAPITLGKPALAANCALMLTCSAALYGNLIYLADMWIIPSHMAGMAQLRPGPSGMPPLLGTPVWSAPVWIQAAHGSSLCRAPRLATALPTVPGGFALGNLKWLMSQLSSCASKSSLSLNTFFVLHHLQCLIILLKQPLLLMVFSAPLCACFYIHLCNCRHVGVLIVHQC